MQAITQAAEKWFTSRGIDPETVVREGIGCTDDGSEIVFPYTERGAVVNRKYRGRGKTFRQDAGAVQTWWGHDVLLEKPERVIIVEGEIDRLTAIECGYANVLSVPSGAPQSETEPEVDAQPGARYHFIYRTWPLLKDVGHFVIATDGDEPGRVMANDLVKRFRPSRCSFVSYPDGCKDLNEVLLKHGQAGVVQCLDSAKPWPVKGLYAYADLPAAPIIQPHSTGWENLDEYFRPFPGMFAVMTGYPGAGKSQFCASLLANLTSKHDWHCTCAVFEEHPHRFAAEVKRSRAGRYHGQLSEPENRDLDQWIGDHFAFVHQDVLSDDEDMNLEYFLDRCEASVLRNDTKLILLDPWNEIDHKRRRDETETDYVSRAIRTMKRFAKAYGVAMIVVAHPTKDAGANKSSATLYDIAGSSHWINKCDVGLILKRDPNTPILDVSIRKTRFREATKHGDCRLAFDWQSGRYTPVNGGE